MEPSVTESESRKRVAESRPAFPSLGIVVIGRNEGERLLRCLGSIDPAHPAVYVDSGSSDGSISAARDAQMPVIALPADRGFTAARARNAGMRHLAENVPDLAFVQMIDGDCELDAGWLEAAIAAMDADSGLAAVFGRRREQFADTTIYNRLCDIEWAVPPGPAEAFGGDVLLRCTAIEMTGGYRETMIAGEDPDLSVRLRKAGWRIVCIDAPMSWHDAAMSRFGQYWRRTARAGHAFAELAALHPERATHGYHASCRRILFWGGAIPAAALIALAIALLSASEIALAVTGALVLLVPAQIARLTIREARRRPWREAFVLASFLMIGKYAEMTGVAHYHWNRLRSRQSVLIEYKSADS